MSDEVEEIPPYEEWLVKDLRVELSNRGLHNGGPKTELVERLYMDDDIGVDEVEADEPTGSAEVVAPDPLASVGKRGWVDGNYFYHEVIEDIGRDDFNKLPDAESHHRMLIESHHVAVTTSNRTVLGGPFDGQLVNKMLVGNKVLYRYRVILRPE